MFIVLKLLFSSQHSPQLAKCTIVFIMVIDPFICIVDIIPAAAPNQDTNTDQAHNLCITWSNYLHWWGLRLIGWIPSVVKLATSFPITIRKGTIKCSLICTNNVSWTHCMFRQQFKDLQFWYHTIRFTIFQKEPSKAPYNF